MSSGGEIEPPFILASLPHPIDPLHGHTAAAAVCSLRAGKRRKRTEVAVGIDGEGIFIYALQNPHLVASYALPPQTYFATAPCSLYQRGGKKSTTRRFTYAATTQSSVGGKAQLICFVEENQNDNAQIPQKYTFDVPGSMSKITSIEIVSAPYKGESKFPPHDVIYLADNGEIGCLSSDLKISRWNYNLKTLSFSKEGLQMTKGYEIEHASLIDAKAISRGLLKSRDDIIALLNPSMETGSAPLRSSQIMCVVSRREHAESGQYDHRTLEFFHLSTRSPDTITIHRPQVEHLLTWQLPEPSRIPSNSAVPHYSLHPTAGTLHQLANGIVISYDFSGTVPRMYSELKCAPPSPTSFTRVSSDLVFAASEGTYGLYNVRYNSVQCLLPVTAAKESSAGHRKRKHGTTSSNGSAGDPMQTAPNLITYFSETGLIVGMHNHELVGFQVSQPTARKTAKSMGSLLINSIGKGNPSKRSKKDQGSKSVLSKPLLGYIPGSIVEGTSEGERWRKRTTKLNKLASSGDIGAFERLFASEIGVSLSPDNVKDRSQPQSYRAKMANGTSHKHVPNGISHPEAEASQDSENERLDTDSAVPSWQFPTTITDTQRYSHRHKAIYALGKIFTWGKVTDSSEHSAPGQPQDLSISIKFFPPNVFQWILLSDYFTKDLVRRALWELSPDRLENFGSISDGDLVKAIVQFDPTLMVLYAVLNHTTHLPIVEVVEAIKVLIQNLEDNRETERQLRLLTDRAAPEKDESDVEIHSQLATAAQDLDYAFSILNDGLFIRGQSLRPALMRLHCFPAPLITSSLRRALSHSELISLVQLLHVELKNGGWTAPYYYDDSDIRADELMNEDPSDRAVAVIASLLSSTIDALGAAGWLAAVRDSSEISSTEDMIHELYKETTEALNGFWEAGFMGGLLNDFLRHAWRMKKNKKPGNATLRKQGKPITVDSWREGTSDPSGLPMLPLGGNVDVGVSSTKVGKGGKVDKRSAREMGMLISKRVPKYSLERIVI